MRVASPVLALAACAAVLSLAPSAVHARGGDPNGDDLPDWQAWTNAEGGPRSILLDADLETLQISMTGEEASRAGALASSSSS